jgi:DNA-binding protein
MTENTADSKEDRKTIEAVKQEEPEKAAEPAERPAQEPVGQETAGENPERSEPVQAGNQEASKEPARETRKSPEQPETVQEARQEEPVARPEERPADEKLEVGGKAAKPEKEEQEKPGAEEKPKPERKPAGPEKPRRVSRRDNVILVGRKPAMSYVMAVVTQFSGGASEVDIKARGRSISRAVDVAEVARKRFVKDANYRIDIGTDEIRDEQGNRVNVSSININLSK